LLGEQAQRAFERMADVVVDGFVGQIGRTGVFALGRKTWSTSAGDAGLFELHACEFGARARAGAALGGAAREARGGEAADGCA
ncbi:hypothetical protein QMA69_28615, partial [Burkholderia pseudomallei]|nr:hypothetical protein [Burkholderia pseudomallei]